MAQRRMFSLKVVDTDAFMDMPLSAQALYFHLGMRADDDGFVSNARRVQKLVGAADDDLKILILKRFVITFESGVIVMKHWRLNNYVKGDRYTPTLYQEEKSTLYVKSNGVYTDHPISPPPEAKPNQLPPASPAEMPGQIPEASCIQNGSILDTQVRIGKVSVGEVSVGQDSLGKSNYISGDDDARAGNARARAEEILTTYLRNQGSYLPDYFGANDETLSNAQLFATVLFGRWTSRQPTEEDVARVFFATRHQERDPETQEWIVTFPQDERDLLMYAFEKASNAGKPGDWNYIQGVLRNLRQRNIKTLDQATDYDFKRDTELKRW